MINQVTIDRGYLFALERLAKAAIAMQDYASRVTTDPMQVWSASPADEFNEALEAVRKWV